MSYRLPSIDQLSQEEIDAVRVVFDRYDIDRSGEIDVYELSAALKDCGHTYASKLGNEDGKLICPSDEDVFSLLAMIDLNGDGKIVFSEFLQLFVAQKTQMSKEYEEAELWEVFVSLGGNADRTGFIQKTQLEEIVRKFGLAIDLEKWFDEVDLDKNGKIDYSELSLMLLKNN